MDITNASDFVTVLWNRFENHDKVMLIGNAENYVYSWGAGIESAIYAENNFFQVNPSTAITPDQFIERLNGTAIHEAGTLLNSPSQSGYHALDALAAYNQANDPDLLSDLSWTPALYVNLLETQDVLPSVEAGAGPFNW